MSFGGARKSCIFHVKMKKTQALIYRCHRPTISIPLNPGSAFHFPKSEIIIISTAIYLHGKVRYRVVKKLQMNLHSLAFLFGYSVPTTPTVNKVMKRRETVESGVAAR